MSLWVDKYRPRQLSQLSYHDSITQNLKALASSGDFPHLLVYGPTGAGKKTRIYATLYELFGPLIEKLKIDVKTFVTSLNRKLEFNVLSSPYHLEITPSDMGNNDRVVIQDLLKDVASTEQVDFTNSTNSHNISNSGISTQASGSGAAGTKHRFKVVIINEADSLSRDAQAALRRTMEKYSSNIRLIMICNTTSNIIPPIKSRTLLIRIPAPSKQEIGNVLSNIARKESVKFSTEDNLEIDNFLQEVAENCERNVRKSMLCFETILMQNQTIQIGAANSIVKLDWEVIIEQLAKSISSNRTVANLAKVRVVFYELLSHCIPARIILKKVLFSLLQIVPKSVVPVLVTIAATFDERLSLGQKSIFHLEGFAAKAMVAIEKN